MFRRVDWAGKIRREGDERVVVLPRELVLEGDDILIVQDKWGDISIHPQSPEGLKACERFGPFADDDDDES